MIQKRLVAATYLVVYLIVVANHFLEWGLFGQGEANRLALPVLMFVGLFGWGRFGPRMTEEIEAHNAALREKENAAERARDKSGDRAEIAQLRHDIGMPPDTSRERTRRD